MAGKTFSRDPLLFTDGYASRRGSLSERWVEPGARRSSVLWQRAVLMHGGSQPLTGNSKRFASLSPGPSIHSTLIYAKPGLSLTEILTRAFDRLMDCTKKSYPETCNAMSTFFGVCSL